MTDEACNVRWAAAVWRLDAAKVHKVVNGLDGLPSDGDVVCNCRVTEEL